MKRKVLLLAMAGAMSATLAGCEFLGMVADKAAEDLQAVRRLKEKGCEQLSPAQKQIAIRIAKLYVPHYPDGGICDRAWVQNTLYGAVAKALSASEAVQAQPPDQTPPGPLAHPNPTGGGRDSRGS